MCIKSTGGGYSITPPAAQSHNFEMAQSKTWTITLNNYTEDEVKTFDQVVAQGKANYLCYQKEVAPSTGTPHLQAYIALAKRARLTGVKKLLGSRIHAVSSNGTPSSNRAYCSKEEGSVPQSFKEFGEIPADPKRGTRSDFEEFRTAVEEGLRCKKKARTAFPDLVAKYPRWCYDIIADQKDLSCEEHELYEWQKSLKVTIDGPANDREVIFVVDKEGNTGKTWFAKHYTKCHSDAQFMEPSKKADMAYALQDNLRVLFINITRMTDTDKSEYIYGFIESVKDGMVFSPKYESRMKYYDKTHVVVMMNHEPNTELLSADRYNIIYLN